jgi:phosphoenolpyruvate carboxykinase (ATP)
VIKAICTNGCFCSCGLETKTKTELYEQAIKYEKGSFITSTGALATLSGAKTGRSPRDKRVVKDQAAAQELWWGK